MGAMRSRAEPSAPLDPPDAAGGDDRSHQEVLGQPTDQLLGTVAAGDHVGIGVGHGAQGGCGGVELGAELTELVDQGAGRGVEPRADQPVEHVGQPGAHGEKVGDQRVVGEHAADGVGAGTDPAGGELGARRGGDDLLEAVGLVEHDQVVGRQHDAAGGDMRAVEVGVDHDDVGLGRPAAGRLGEARLALGALGGAGALLGADADRLPHHGAGLDRQLCPVADLGLVGPLEHGPQSGVVGLDVEAALAVGEQLGHALAAHVVGPALEHGPPEAAEVLVEERQVLLAELVLQRLGGGGHHDAGSRLDGGDQVPKRLARAGARLDHQVSPRFERGRHGFGHLALPVAHLAAAGQLGHQGGQGGGGVGHRPNVVGRCVDGGGCGHPPSMPTTSDSRPLTACGYSSSRSMTAPERLAPSAMAWSTRGASSGIWTVPCSCSHWITFTTDP